MTNGNHFDARDVLWADIAILGEGNLATCVGVPDGRVGCTS